MVKLKRIDEAKQVGTIYHVCNPESAIYNIEHNSITPSQYSNTVKGKKTISFTRDKNFIVDTIRAKAKVFYQFVLDGDKLSDHKKILPYADIAYQAYFNLEKEEVVLGKIDNLKSYIQEVVVFVNVSAIESSYASKDYTVEESVILSLDLLANYGVKTSVRVVIGPKNLSPVNTNLPKDVKSLSELFKKVNAYSSSEMFLALTDLSKKFFGSRAYVTTKPLNFSSIINIEFKDIHQKVTSVKNEIQSLVDTIKEELDCRGLIVTQTKSDSKVLKRHGDTKLSTVLNNRTYTIESISINPYFDYLYNQSPLVRLTLFNSNLKPLTFLVFYQL